MSVGRGMLSYVVPDPDPPAWIVMSKRRRIGKKGRGSFPFQKKCCRYSLWGHCLSQFFSSANSSILGWRGVPKIEDKLMDENGYRDSLAIVMVLIVRVQRI